VWRYRQWSLPRAPPPGFTSTALDLKTGEVMVRVAAEDGGVR